MHSICVHSLLLSTTCENSDKVCDVLKKNAEEDFLQKFESLNLDPRLKKLLITYEEVFGALPPPLSCKKTGPDGPETET